jgi:hypothetical protein
VGRGIRYNTCVQIPRATPMRPPEQHQSDPGPELLTFAMP